MGTNVGDTLEKRFFHESPPDEFPEFHCAINIFFVAEAAFSDDLATTLSVTHSMCCNLTSSAYKPDPPKAVPHYFCPNTTTNNRRPTQQLFSLPPSSKFNTSVD